MMNHPSSAPCRACHCMSHLTRTDAHPPSSCSPAFYEGYEEEYPLPEGFEERKVIYNLYHVLNHYVLFGGGYLSQAQSMMGTILMDDTR